MSQPSSISNFGVALLAEDASLRCVAQYALVVFFLGFLLVPLETGIMAAIRTDESVACSPLSAPPVGEGFTFGNIQFALEQFLGSFPNPLIMLIPATIGGVLFGSMAAYGLTMVNWRVQTDMLVLLVVGVFVPYQAALVPLVCLWNNISPLARMIEPMVASIPLFQGCHAELVLLVTTHIAYGIPICTVLFRLYYQSPPDSLVEAGKISGASVTKIYWRIILLISKSTFGVVFTYQFMRTYNEFLFVSTLVTGFDAPAVPVTLVLPTIGASTSNISFDIRMSAAPLAAVSTLIPYVVSAEQLVKGLRTEA